METAIVLDSVKKMLSSGLDEDVIKSTLQDLGLTDAQIEEVMAQASGKPVAVKSNPAPAPTASPIVPPAAVESAKPSTAPIPKPVMDELVKQQQIQNYHQATTQASFEQHAQKLDDVHQSVTELHDKVDDLSENMTAIPDSSAKMNLLTTRLSQIEREIMELKAQGNALQSLLSKVLETNRDVLLELQRRENR